MSRPAEDFDAAIVGGGLVGISLAVALATIDLKVLLVEAFDFRKPSESDYDDRTLALSEGSCRILAGLGAWEYLAEPATAIRSVRVWEAGRPGRLLLKAGEFDLPQFGHTVAAHLVGQGLLSRLKELKNVELACPARLLDIQSQSNSVSIRYGDEENSATASVRLLIGADGAHSSVREYLGIDTESHDYEQTAIVCNFTPEIAHGGQAFECLRASGPFAVLPQPGDRCGMVWTVESPKASQLLELSDPDFLSAAQEIFGNHLGRFTKCGRRSSYPLKLVRALHDRGPRCVILGNASHAIHPIGAQGFNLGLRDVAVLAELLADERDEASFDPGSEDLLQRYSAWRRDDHSGTVGWSDGLARLFANRSFVAGLLRSGGLWAHALIPPLRRQATIRAMGYRGRVPRLALGQTLRQTPSEIQAL